MLDRYNRDVSSIVAPTDRRMPVLAGIVQAHAVIAEHSQYRGRSDPTFTIA
jgi:hypothetical protein